MFVLQDYSSSGKKLKCMQLSPVNTSEQTKVKVHFFEIREEDISLLAVSLYDSEMNL